MSTATRVDDALSALRYIRERYGELDGVGWGRLQLDGPRVVAWRCEGCGEYVEPDHGALGHTRTVPDADGNATPAACGPVTPFRPVGGGEVPRYVHRALALVEQALESEERCKAIMRQTGGNAPELVQGILDGIVRLYRRSLVGYSKSDLYAAWINGAWNGAETAERRTEFDEWLRERDGGGDGS